MPHLAFLVCLIHFSSLNITKILGLVYILGLNNVPGLLLLYMKQNQTHPGFVYLMVCVICLPSSLKLTTDDGDILLDYSKNLVNEEVMRMLFDMVQSTIFTSETFFIKSELESDSGSSQLSILVKNTRLQMLIGLMLVSLTLLLLRMIYITVT